MHKSSHVSGIGTSQEQNTARQYCTSIPIKAHGYSFDQHTQKFKQKKISPVKTKFSSLAESSWTKWEDQNKSTVPSNIS